MPSGMPSSGPASPLAIFPSLALACASAFSGVSTMKALRPFAFDMASTIAWVSSTAENVLAARPSRASRERQAGQIGHCHAALVHRFGGVRSDYSITFGTTKKPSSRAGALARTFVHDIAVGDDVGAFLHAHRQNRGHRLDAFDIDGVQLLDEAQDGVDLILQIGRFLPRSRGCARDGRCAAPSPDRPTCRTPCWMRTASTAAYKVSSLYRSRRRGATIARAAANADQNWRASPIGGTWTLRARSPAWRRRKPPASGR